MYTVGTNLTYEDPSKWIEYVGDWNTNHADDNKTYEYSQADYHATWTDGDYLTFNWTGGDIWVYGAKRFNHGWYSVSLDDGDKQYMDGFNLLGQIPTCLWSTYQLDSGPHSIKVTNENIYGEGKTSNGAIPLVFFDLDYVVVQGEAGGSGPVASAPPLSSGIVLVTDSGQVPTIAYDMPGPSQVLTVNGANEGISMVTNGLIGNMLVSWFFLFGAFRMNR